MVEILKNLLATFGITVGDLHEFDLSLQLGGGGLVPDWSNGQRAGALGDHVVIGLLFFQ